MATTYPNGQIPATALASVGGGGQMLRADAAASWLALAAAAKAAGYTLTLTDSYRPLSVQIAIFLDRYKVGIVSPYNDYRVYQGQRYGRRAGAASAAIPGTSNHGSGVAVDITGISNAYGTPRTPAYQWLAANAPAYGWTNPAWAWSKNFWEPWHWEFDPARVTIPVSNPGASVPSAPTITPPTPAPEPVSKVQEDDMIIIRNTKTGSAFVVLGGRGSRLVGSTDLAEYEKAGLKTVNLTPDGYAVAESRYLVKG